MTVIPGQDNLFTITLQSLIFSWTGVTSAGQINVVGMASDPNPFLIYQSVGGDTIVIPFYDEVYPLGTYGLRTSNNSTGGVYTVSAYYTQILP